MEQHEDILLQRCRSWLANPILQNPRTGYEYGLCFALSCDERDVISNRIYNYVDEFTRAYRGNKAFIDEPGEVTETRIQCVKDLIEHLEKS